MRIPLDRSNGIPLYQQIEAWLRQNILSGGLPTDTRLPATRSLADELGVSRITVQNAYAVLESDGLILTREGSGTFVAPVPRLGWAEEVDGGDWPLWQAQFEGQADPLPPQTRHPDLISFTGVGDPRHFPFREFSRTIQEVLRRDGTAALEYGSFDNGHLPLRETVIHILASQGIQSRPEHVLITSGSQQGLALVCQVLFQVGDVVLVEKPTYNLALELFRSLGLKVVGIPVDRNGMQVEELEPLLQQHCPRLIYTIPNFQNPSGACLSSARRRQLLALADRYNVPILEDDFAGDLRYEGRSQPAIKSFDPGGRVIYLGTFSKILMPGLRVGYLLAHGPVFEQFVRQKRVLDLTTTPLMQRALDRYVTIGRYQAYLRSSVRLFRQRRDAMVTAVQRHLPETAFSIPQGGLFLWLKFADGFSSSQLLPAALSLGVEFAPGVRFFADPAEGEPYLRLNFASCTPQEIETGIRRLRQAVEMIS